MTWHHGFSVPYGTPPDQEAWGDAVSAEMGSDTIRIPLAWDAYQTGVNQYNLAALDGIVTRVHAARAWSPYAYNPRAVIIFELPDTQIPWMQQAGYQLTAGTGSNHPRYYPASLEGEKAYGKAMAKALGYLYSNTQVAWGIETPNEPNLKNGPAWSIPAEYIGRLGAFGLTYAAAEGLPILAPEGPTVLIGAVSTNPDTANASEGKTPAQYFRLVQTSANYWINWWYLGSPNGQSTAELLMGTWRASFHSYPGLGQGEAFSCQRMQTGQGQKLQDELGDTTGVGAYNEVKARLDPVIDVLNEVPWKKHWWLTETGMTSFKTNVSNETYANCINRRAAGGSTFGKAQQKEFYQELAYNLDVQHTYGSFPWSWFEGVTFFEPLDTTYAPADPFKGFGAFWAGCGNYCWKPSGIYFANTL